MGHYTQILWQVTHYFYPDYKSCNGEGRITQICFLNYENYKCICIYCGNYNHEFTCLMFYFSTLSLDKQILKRQKGRQLHLQPN